jgi:hypothetical protein
MALLDAAPRGSLARQKALLKPLRTFFGVSAKFINVITEF